LLTESGEIYSFGYGKRGQLGHGDQEDQTLPKLIEAMRGKRVVQVSAGANHSLVLTESGAVFSFGHGAWGQLGHGNRERQNLPKLIEAMRGKRVVQISAGWRHNLVLTESGEVYSFGWGYYGRLGHGDTEKQTLPKLMEALQGKRVVQVSAGCMHSLVLTASGEVYSFGAGYYCRLGHGDEENQTLPKLIEALRGKKVVQVSACSSQSLVLTESGEVYSFGHGSYGKLGHGDTEQQSLPKLIEALKDKRVVQVSAGYRTSVMILESGEVLECGMSSRDKTFHVLVPESVENAVVAGPTVVKAW
jgi:alpha-tubulin suppressor-like RCC1 family protein